MLPALVAEHPDVKKKQQPRTSRQAPRSAPRAERSERSAAEPAPDLPPRAEAPRPASPPDAKLSPSLVIGAGALLVAAVLGVRALRSESSPTEGATAEPPATTSAAAMAAKVKAETPAWSDAESPVPVTSEDPVWGHRDALVTVVVFSDFQCPYCAKVVPTLHALHERYGDDKLRIVWKNLPLPFHSLAKPAAQAAQAVRELAGSQAFFAFHDKVFAGQRGLSPASFERWAEEVGVSPAALRAQLKTGSAAKKVEADMELAGKVGASGTPAFRVNGVFLSGAQPLEAFQKIIDEQLALADEELKKGTARERIYVELSKRQFTKPAEQGDEESDEIPDGGSWKVPIGDSPQSGPKEALVTVVEFADYQCPFCQKGADALASVRKDYEKDLRVVWKDCPLPFHDRAKPAALLARAVRAEKGDEAYWKASSLLFANMRALSDADLESYAARAGAPGLRIEKLRDDKLVAALEADLALAKKLGVDGTPAYFINGYRLSGAQPEEAFRKVIDQELARAKKAVEGGVKREALYDHLTKDGKEKAR